MGALQVSRNCSAGSVWRNRHLCPLHSLGYLRFLILFSLSLFQVPLGGCRALFGPPSDAQLESLFSSHEAEFNQLSVMAAQDQHLVRIASTFTWLDTDASWPRQNIGLSAARWNQYRELFESLGLRGGIVRSTDYPGVIFFQAYSFGLVTGGSYKGYAYSVSPLTPQLSSLDSVPVLSKGPSIGFKQIRRNWYIYDEEH